MEYNAENDKEIQSDTMPTDDKSGLRVAVMQYGNSKPKLSILEYYTNKQGEIGYKKIGRLSRGQALWVSDKIQEWADVF